MELRNIMKEYYWFYKCHCSAPSDEHLPHVGEALLCSWPWGMNPGETFMTIIGTKTHWP